MGFQTGGLVNSSGTASSLAPNATGSTLALSGSSTALQFISTQTTGNDAFKINNNGARWHIGTGTTDYLTSDGAQTVVAAGGLKATSLNASSAAGSGGVSITDTTNTRTTTLLTANDVLTFYNNAVAAMMSLNGTTKQMTLAADIAFTAFSDGSATPGAAINNNVRGKNAIALGAASVVITNSFVAATSTVLCVLESVDATLTFIKACVPGAGSFTLTGNANATAATKFSFIVFN